MKISSLKKGSNFSINIKNIKLDKKLLVAIVFLVLSILGGGAYLYYENEKTKKLEQARLQKIQKENSDKQTYLSDFKSAFEGLDYQALTGFYEVLRSDIDFFRVNNWLLDVMDCNVNCNLAFKRGSFDTFTYLEMNRNGAVIKPQFDQNKLQFANVDYMSGFHSVYLLELTEQERDKRENIIEQCSTKLSELYNLQLLMKEQVKFKINLPRNVTSISGYDWVKNSDIKFGSIEIENMPEKNLGLMKNIMNNSMVITSISLQNSSFKSKLNYYCY